jgi:hypothetical protein
MNSMQSSEATSPIYFQSSVEYLKWHLRRSLPFNAREPRPDLLRISSTKFQRKPMTPSRSASLLVNQIFSASPWPMNS